MDINIDINIKIKIPEILISKSKIGKVYGWRPPTPNDLKRYAFLHPLKTFKLKSNSSGAADPLPTSVDLRSGKYKMPPVYDQLSLGGCVANVIAAILEFNELNRPSIGEDSKNSDAVSAMRPSRLFIYYFGRLKSGNVQEDSGMMIYDGVGAVSLVGYCPEEVPIWNIHNIPKVVCWPYDVDKFAEKPPMKSILFARNHKGVNAKRIDGTSLFQLKSALAKGYPVAFGMILFESFESDELRKTGIMKMPDVEKEGLIGGHALAIIGYDDTKQIGNETGAFCIRNSWGSMGWGLDGYFYCLYSVITNPSICMDFWIIPSSKNNY